MKQQHGRHLGDRKESRSTIHTHHHFLHHIKILSFCCCTRSTTQKKDYMRHASKIALSIVLLAGCIPATYADDCEKSNVVTTCFVQRSQGRDKTVQVVGTTDFTHLYDADCWYATLSITPEYTKSMHNRRKDICECLFGPVLQTNATGASCDECSIRIQGCGITGANRATNALAADNFYLPSDFDSTVRFTPAIRNIMVNFDLYVGLGTWFDCFENVYFRLYAPFTHSRWNLGMKETVLNTGAIEPSYGFGDFTPGSLSPSDLLDSFTEFASGCNAPKPTTGERYVGQTENNGNEPIYLPDPIQTVCFQPLKYSKLDPCERRRNGVADLRAEFGWDIFNCPDYHLGTNWQIAFPTGTHDCAEYLFMPRVGSGHWETGGGLSAHYTLWRSNEETCSLSIWLDANITHQFRRREERVFDLKNKPLSRYLLASKFRPLNNDNEVPSRNIGIVTRGAPQFYNEYAPVANLTKQTVRVSAAIHADVVAWLNATWCNWTIDLGYNFWARSCERIDCDDCPCDGLCGSTRALDGQTWGLKGTAHMFGFAPSDVSPVTGLVPNQAIGTSATQSNATLFGDNACITNPLDNSAIDNPAAPAVAGRLAGGTNLKPQPNSPGQTPTLNTSIPPIFLTQNDVDMSIRTRGLSHKVFGHVSYIFDRDCYTPFIGFGGFAEFAQNGGKDCPSTSTTASTSTKSKNCCDKTCIDCGVSQWGLWVKGGIFFN